MIRLSRFLSLWLAGGFLLLYLPIALLVAISFNDSRLTTEWTGLSLRWYRALAADNALTGAAWLSLRVGVASATLATVLGGAAGVALARFGRFAFRPVFTGLLTAPLVLPDLLIGLSLLLLFVVLEQAIGWPAGRGALTIILAHATVGLAFVAITVQARLADAGTMLEEAAMDLGATPARAFLRITLPLMAPALAAGWLLAFTLSLDDVVVASFVSGPGASTLPMVVFSTLRLGATPVLNALATVLLALIATLLLAASRLGPVLRR
ncbi:MAG TPA: ABC transporter permease subunit [Acetobacteraceae bacterium]|jgi:putrescine transport system permease protein